MNSEHKEIAVRFVQDIWNEQNFEKIGRYLSLDFVDHSLPPSLPANEKGTKQWIAGTSKSFQHKTKIDDVVCEGEKVMMKITMQLKHIGVWRDVEPTHYEISAVGYRFFKLANGKIAEHWALIDGNAIENQLRKAIRSCKIQQ